MLHFDGTQTAGYKAVTHKNSVFTALGAVAMMLVLSACASENPATKTSETEQASQTEQTARTESRPMPKCGPGETLMCQTGKTGFGRLSTGRKTNYDYCSCEPDSVVIRDTPLPQY